MDLVTDQYRLRIFHLLPSPPSFRPHLSPSLFLSVFQRTHKVFVVRPSFVSFLPSPTPNTSPCQSSDDSTRSTFRVHQTHPPAPPLFPCSFSTLDGVVHGLPHSRHLLVTLQKFRVRVESQKRLGSLISLSNIPEVSLSLVPSLPPNPSQSILRIPPNSNFICSILFTVYQEQITDFSSPLFLSFVCKYNNSQSVFRGAGDEDSLLLLHDILLSRETSKTDVLLDKRLLEVRAPSTHHSHTERLECRSVKSLRPCLRREGKDGDEGSRKRRRDSCAAETKYRVEDYPRPPRLRRKYKVNKEPIIRIGASVFSFGTTDNLCVRAPTDEGFWGSTCSVVESFR